MELSELLDGITDDSCDAVELTRRALVLARSRTDAVDGAANDSAGIVIGDEALRGFIEALSPRLTLDLTRRVREAIRAVLQTTCEESPEALQPGIEGLAAQKLALALEEVCGPRFYDHLAAAGPRILEADDLVPFSSPFGDPKGPFRVAYRGDLAPEPAKLGTVRPGSLRSRGRLRPDVPHAASSRWVPTWNVLDDIEPASVVAAVLPGTELRYETDLDRRVFFDAGPKQPAERTRRAIELLRQVDGTGAHLAILPELCLDSDGLDEVASWVETDSQELRVAVCGSAHHRRQARCDNLAVVASAKETGDYARVEQPKVVPFTLAQGETALEEDIRRAGKTLTLLSGRQQSLLVLICMDFIDVSLSRFAEDLRPSLVLVPACSETTGVFGTTASQLAERGQAHVVVVNQHPGQGQPDAAILARPRRETSDVLKVDGSHEPGVRRIPLAEGEWEPGY